MVAVIAVIALLARLRSELAGIGAESAGVRVLHFREGRGVAVEHGIGLLGEARETDS